MLILHPVDTFIGMLVDDLKEYPKEWLKFLFVESPIGWIMGGLVSLMSFLAVSTIIYWTG